MTIQRFGGVCGATGGAILLVYFLWNALVVPPFSSGRAFLEFAAAWPHLAFFDDWLFLTWFLLTLGLLLGLHQRLAPLAGDEAHLSSVVGAVGLLIAVMRSVFNIGRTQVLAAEFGTATEPEREFLTRMLAWTEQGDVARNLALVLVGAWVLWSGTLMVRTGWFPRWLAWLGVVAGSSVVPALVGYLMGVHFLTQPAGYLAVVFILWAAWTTSTGIALLSHPRGHASA